MSWGKLTSIDLRGCDGELIRNRAYIAAYARQLVKLIDMRAYGSPKITHFGSCKEVEGFTLVQLIETSLISGHFVNHSNEAYIDIFSCKNYNSELAALFTQNEFKAAKMKYTVLIRGE